jgi:hypothetical protein
LHPQARDGPKLVGEASAFSHAFHPTSSSWLNVLERFFRELTDKRIRRVVFRNVHELTEVIYDYLESYDNEPRPFVWTRNAGAIPQKIGAPLCPKDFLGLFI